jgi:hypothetical protein
VVLYLSGRKYHGYLRPLAFLASGKHGDNALHPSLPRGSENVQNAEFVVQRHGE